MVSLKKIADAYENDQQLTIAGEARRILAMAKLDHERSKLILLELVGEDSFNRFMNADAKQAQSIQQELYPIVMELIARSAR